MTPDPTRTDEDRAARRRWRHRTGDEYVVVAPSIVGNPEAGYDTVYAVHPPVQPTLAHAKRYGFTIGRSDDFNIGVLRRGELVASLWMDEVVDDNRSDLADMAEAIRAFL